MHCISLLKVKGKLTDDLMKIICVPHSLILIDSKKVYHADAAVAPKERTKSGTRC